MSFGSKLQHKWSLQISVLLNDKQPKVSNNIGRSYMYITSKQTTMECCLSISIYFMLLPCQSINSQPSISFVRVLNYEFPFNILVFVRFAHPFIPLPTIPNLIPFSMIKCGYRNQRKCFLSIFIPIYHFLSKDDK